MPDWLTHLGIAWVVCNLLNLRRRETSIVVLGSFIPDLAKVAYLMNYFTSWYTAQMLARPLHTPIGSLLTAIVISSLFKKEDWKKITCLLAFGIGIHLMLDSFLWPWPQMDSGILLLWPLSWKSYSFGLIWSDDPRPLLITASFVVGIIAYKRHKNKNRQDRGQNQFP